MLWYLNVALHYDIMEPSERVVHIMEENYMTGKEILNLITALEKEGMSAEKIIEIIKYIESADPKDPSNSKQI